mgnify:CR=1
DMVIASRNKFTQHFWGNYLVSIEKNTFNNFVLIRGQVDNAIIVLKRFKLDIECQTVDSNLVIETIYRTSPHQAK